MAEDNGTQGEGGAAEEPTVPVEPWEGFDRLNVQQVVAELEDLDDEAVAQVKAYEAEHKNRSGVLDYSRTPEGLEHTEEDVFTRERLLGGEGARITGHPTATIVGALYDADADQDTFTREELDERIAKFLDREDESQTAEQATAAARREQAPDAEEAGS